MGFQAAVGPSLARNQMRYLKENPSSKQPALQETPTFPPIAGIKNLLKALACLFPVFF